MPVDARALEEERALRWEERRLNSGGVAGGGVRPLKVFAAGVAGGAVGWGGTISRASCG